MPRLRGGEAICVSCRLRRKKCDKKTPACSRCVRLQVPCVYKESVGLRAKDSHATLEDVKRRRRELEEELESLTRKLNRLRVQDASSLEGYLTLSQDLSLTKSKLPAAFTTLKLLTQERQKFIQSMGEPCRETPCLAVYEERCVAGLVGAGIPDGEFVILQMIGELLSLVVPPEKEYRVFMINYKTQIPSRAPFFGMAPLSEELTDTIMNVVAFDAHGIPYLTFDLYKEGNRMVHLALLLIVLSMFYYVISRDRAMETEYPLTWNYTLCLRYASALLNVGLLNTKIRMGDHPEKCWLVTLALVQLHIYQRCTLATNFETSRPDTQETVLLTRQLITRCKLQHLHEWDLGKFYPELGDADRYTIRSMWYALVYFDLVGSLEVGMTTGLTQEEISPIPPEIDVPTVRGLVKVHEQVQVLSSLDPGKVNVDIMMQVVESCADRLREVYKSLGTTVEEDFAEAESVKGKYPTGSLGEFYRCIERMLVRALVTSTMASAYEMCVHCFDRVGESLGESDRVFVCKVLAYKYAMAGVEINGLFKKLTHVVGNDMENQSGHCAVIVSWHFLTAIEGICTKRALLMWSGFCASYAVTRTEDIRLFWMYHKINPDVERRILEKINATGTVAVAPTTEEILDVDVDKDLPKLIKTYAKLVDPKVLIRDLAQKYLVWREQIEPIGINLGFMKMTETYLIGTRYTCIGLRLFFPEEAYNIHAEKKVFYEGVLRNPATRDLRKAMERWGIPVRDYSSVVNGRTDFAETFAELFDKEIDIGSGRLEFGDFFDGVNKDELFKEAIWEPRNLEYQYY